MLKTLSKELQELYQTMQKCTECKLGKEGQNKPKPGERYWRQHGWGKETDLVIIGMNPTSGRNGDPDGIPWGRPTLSGMPFNDTYLHWALRNLGWCDCEDLGKCEHRWYQTNIVKCCTSDNQLIFPRDKEFIQPCMKNFLLKELKLLKPKAILLMGKTVGPSFGFKIIPDIRNSKEVFPFYDRTSLADTDMGINSVVGIINHSNYWRKGTRLTEPKKEKVKEYIGQIQPILERAKLKLTSR
ncbi:MAG: uracil-DNA glycosylase family protein [bacterium]